MKLTSALIAAALAASGACTKSKEPPAKRPVEAKPATTPRPAQAAPEVPVTSTSPQAAEAFRKGRNLFENARVAEAAELFRKAIVLDPKLAQAHAYLGMTTPGPAGAKHVEQAISLARNLPETERLVIEIAQAQSRGEDAKARELSRRLAAIAPADWRAQYQLGQQLFFAEWKLEEAIGALRRAIALNPGGGAAYNALAYAHAYDGNHADAVTAVKKYAALKPEEPNPQDTLGEILLMVGQFEESEAAFRKAAAISPRFWNAWEGVAMTRFYRGDWAGGREMLAKAREAATRPTEKLAVDEETARSYEAEGKAAEAMKALDALEREAKVLKVETHWVAAPLAKARALSSQGKHKEALARVAEAASRREKASALPLGFVRNLRVRESMARLVAEAALGQPTGARKSLAEIEEDARKSPGNAWTQSLLHLARGLAGVAQGNDKAAARHFSQCLGADTYCQWRLLLAQEKVGDKAGAAATRDRILKTRHRDASYLYVWSRLGATGQAGRRPSVE